MRERSRPASPQPVYDYLLADACADLETKMSIALSSRLSWLRLIRELDMIFSSSRNHCRYLLTILKLSGTHNVFLSTTDNVRSCLLVCSLMNFVAASLFFCCVLVHAASVVTSHSRTTCRYGKTQPNRKYLDTR